MESLDKNISFINSEFEFKNPSKESFNFLIFKSVKDIDVLVHEYSIPIDCEYNIEIAFISLYDLETKKKIREYKSQNVSCLEHYYFNNQDLLIIISTLNLIIIYDIEKDININIIENPADNSSEYDETIFEISYCPFFIQDGKIRLITCCYSDNNIKVWDYDSNQLITKVLNFEFTYCVKVFTDKDNKIYLIATNKKLISYTLPDFQIFKKYSQFSVKKRRVCSIEQINDFPLIFVFDEGCLKIFEFYSGDLFKKFILGKNYIFAILFYGIMIN